MYTQLSVQTRQNDRFSFTGWRTTWMERGKSLLKKYLSCSSPLPLLKIQLGRKGHQVQKLCCEAACHFLQCNFMSCSNELTPEQHVTLFVLYSPLLSARQGNPPWVWSVLLSTSGLRSGKMAKCQTEGRTTKSWSRHSLILFWRWSWMSSLR